MNITVCYFSWYFHLKLPVWVHKVEVALTFFEQLVLPYMMIVPHRWFRIFAAVTETFFMFCVVSTGNYAWINYVGVLPCIALLDDDFIEMLEKNVFQKILAVLKFLIHTVVGYIRSKLTEIWPALNHEVLKTTQLSLKECCSI